MKKTILILSVLFFLSCKKESNQLVGKWNHIATIVDNQYISDSTQNESFYFNDNGTYINTVNGSGNYQLIGCELILNEVSNNVIFGSRTMRVNNTDVYFKSN